jgi:branched-chain amino acid transport system permease protein
MMNRLFALSRQHITMVVFALIIAFGIPMIWDKGQWLKVFTQAVIYCIASLGVGLLYGRVGMVSLANFALFGVGGWVAIRLAHTDTLPVPLCVLLGGVVAAIIATIVGLPALRIKGLYLALITLMAAGAFYVVISVIGFSEGKGGFTGRKGVGNRRTMPRPSFAKTDVAYFRYAVFVAVLAFILVIIHLRTRPGRAWALVKRSQAAAYSAGVNTTLYKTWAFTLAGFLSGLAGGMSVGFAGTLNSLDFTASSSLLLFALAVSAGAYHLSGAVIAAFLAKVLPAIFTQKFDIAADVTNIIFGVLLMFSLTQAPEGAAGLVNAVGQSIKSKVIRRPASVSLASADVEVTP